MIGGRHSTVVPCAIGNVMNLIARTVIRGTSDEGQIWLLQPHNAAHQTGRPRTLRALWGLAHITDPSRAKYWVDPYGTSGMYMKRDCYKDTYGTVYRCLLDNTVHDAKDLPTSLEVVS